MCDVTTKMAAPIEQWTNIEVRGVIRFLQAKGNNPTEIHRDLVTEKLAYRKVSARWVPKQLTEGTQVPAHGPFFAPFGTV